MEGKFWELHFRHHTHITFDTLREGMFKGFLTLAGSRGQLDVSGWPYGSAKDILQSYFTGIQTNLFADKDI